MGARNHPEEKASNTEEASPLARLVAERGATMPTRDLLAIPIGPPRRPPGGLTSAQVLEEQREERL